MNRRNAAQARRGKTHARLWTLPLALLLLVVAAGCTPPPQAPTDPFGRSLYAKEQDVYDPSPDYAKLRRYDQNDHDADAKVLAAARRVLGGIRFGEITRAELERRLGPPIEGYGMNGRPMLEYSFDNGQEGVAARFEMYEDEYGVVRVLQLESVAGLGGMTGAHDDEDDEDDEGLEP